jgi:hypothetical protein
MFLPLEIEPAVMTQAAMKKATAIFELWNCILIFFSK